MNLCFNYFVVPEAVERLRQVRNSGIENVSIQFILLSYDENELGNFSKICSALPKGTEVDLHPNSFPFNSLNFAERQDELRKQFVNFVLLWIPKFVEGALNEGLIVSSIVLHSGFQVSDYDISRGENVLRRKEALDRVVSSYKEISQGLRKQNCSFSFENGVRAETSQGRLLSDIDIPVTPFEIPYTFDEIKYVIDNCVNMTFDLFKYFETLTIAQVDERIEKTIESLKLFLSSGKVVECQISCVKERSERFKTDLMKEVKNVLQESKFAGKLNLEGYWNQSAETLISDLRFYSN